MQEIMPEATDEYGNYNLYGVYLESKKDIDRRLHRVSYGNGRYIKSIPYKVFAAIVYAYCTELLLESLKNRMSCFYNRFGDIYPVKTKAIRYNPYTYHFKRDAENNIIREKVKLDLNKTNGYVYFFFWNAPKRYRHYRFKVSKVWKLRLLEKIEQGFDVMNITLTKYGRAASSTYIQTIK
jgi:hypothetical protein